MKKIAVVVCTYKRPQLLELALKSLVNQSADKELFNILVVDNNSQDETKAIVDKYREMFDNVDYVLETKQGAGHARNCGYQNSEAEYIAYMDDDAQADKLWIEKAIEVIDNFSPDLFGGPIFPFYLSPKPDWFLDKYEERHTENSSGWFNGVFSGANMFVKKELFTESNGFPTHVGMKGGGLGYGEETALIARFRDEGKKLYFSKELVVTHLVPDLKKSLAYWLYSEYKAGKEGVLLYKHSFESYQLIDLAELVDDAMTRFETALLKRDVEKYRYPENYIVEEASQVFISIGRIVGAYQESKKKNENITLGKDGDIDLYSVEKIKKMRKSTFLKTLFRLIKIYFFKK